ncbi:MAG TPA: hypothetical protein DCS67_06860 [Clostridiales bacterium UBA8960]|nr:hypothetical protein [Clostridiales bacterium UBA8960]
MAKILAYVTGLILSIMVTFNGLLSSFTSTYLSNVIYHAIGLFFFGLLMLMLSRKTSKIKFRWIYLVPGFLGSLTIILNNVVLNAIGVTMMITFTLVGQVITSLMIDRWGLLGKESVKIHTKQWFGVGIMILGLAIMVL